MASSLVMFQPVWVGSYGLPRVFQEAADDVADGAAGTDPGAHAEDSASTMTNTAAAIMAENPLVTVFFISLIDYTPSLPLAKGLP